MTKLGIRWAVLMGSLAALGASGVALALDEVEPNNPIGSAQVLVIDSSGTAQVNGVIGTLTGNPNNDVDFYSFQGKAGDIVTIYTNGTANLDTLIALFGPGPDFTERAADDDAATPPPGSTNSTDSLISSFQLDADGIWTVGVAAAMTTNFASGGVAGFAGAPDSTSFGAYTLTISGVTPPAPPVTQPPVTQPPVTPPPVTPPPPPPAPVVQINIDVLPGFRGLTRFDPKAKRTIPVVLVSNANFDATQVDQSSLTFGATGDEKSFRRCDPHGVDINHDRRRDRLCHFDSQAAAFQPGDLMGVVRGKTLSGQEFEGKGFLKVVNEKRHRRDGDHDRDRHRDRDDR